MSGSSVLVTKGIITNGNSAAQELVLERWRDAEV